MAAYRDISVLSAGSAEVTMKNHASGINPEERAFYYLVLIGFFGIASTTLSKNPVLSLYVRALGGNEALLGVIAAVSPLAGILFSFPVGAMSDRWGRKKILLLAALIFISAPLLYLTVSAPAWLIPIRFFHGMATAILGPVASAAIVGLYPQEKGARLGNYSAVTLVGRTLAPLLGGAMITAFAAWNTPFNYQVVYLAAFLISLPILPIVFLLPDTPPVSAAKAANGTGALRRSLSVFLRSPWLLAVAIVELATYFAFGVLETYLPLYLEARQVPAHRTGLIFTLQILAIAATKPFFGKAADRFDKRWQILLGVVILAGSMLLFPHVDGVKAWAAVVIVFGLGMSLATVATAAYAAEIAARDQLGASLGALSSIMDIGHSSGPLLAGLVIAAATYAVGFHFSFAVCAIAGVSFGMVAFRRRVTFQSNTK
jgi:MFS family permease